MGLCSGPRAQCEHPTRPAARNAGPTLALEGRLASFRDGPSTRALWPSSASAHRPAAHCSPSPASTVPRPAVPLCLPSGGCDLGLPRTGPRLSAHRPRDGCPAAKHSRGVLAFSPSDIWAHGGAPGGRTEPGGAAVPTARHKAGPEGLSSPRCRWGRHWDAPLARQEKPALRCGPRLHGLRPGRCQGLPPHGGAPARARSCDLCTSCHHRSLSRKPSQESRRADGRPFQPRSRTPLPTGTGVRGAGAGRGADSLPSPPPLPASPRPASDREPGRHRTCRY